MIARTRVPATARVALLAGALASAAAAQPAPHSSPLVIVGDLAVAWTFTGYLEEILDALGFPAATRLTTAQTDALASAEVALVAPGVARYGVIGPLRAFVERGGVLIAFEPGGELATLCGLGNGRGDRRGRRIRIDATTRLGAGLSPRPLIVHAPSRRYAPGSATTIAHFAVDGDSPPKALPPAVTVRAVGAGYAVAIAFDLPQAVALMRQGNPAWAGRADNDTRAYGWRPDQMFSRTDRAGRVLESWNGTGDGNEPDHTNDLPQADELMRLLGNAITRLTPGLGLPRKATFPAGSTGVVVMTGDQHVEPLALAKGVVAATEAAGGRYSAYLWHPFFVPEELAESWHAAGHELGVHFDFNEPAGPDWQRVRATMASALRSFRVAYPRLPTPRTVRTDNLLWLARDAAGRLDPLAQARLFAQFGLRMDLSYVSHPATWGFLTGSGLPMRFVDLARGDLVDVYQQATQFQDNTQMAPLDYSLRWSGARMRDEVLRLLEEARIAFDTGLTFNIHTNTLDRSNPGYTYPGWSRATYEGTVRGARTQGASVTTAGAWLQFVEARRRAVVADFERTSDETRFTFAHDLAGGLELDLPVADRVVVAVTVDGRPQPLRWHAAKGTTSLRLALPPGQHRVRVSLGARQERPWLAQPVTWCAAGETQATTGDYDRNGTLDLACQDARTGRVRVRLSDGRGGFGQFRRWAPDWGTATAPTGGLGAEELRDGAPMGPATGSPRRRNPTGGLGAEELRDGAPMGPATGSPRRRNPTVPAADRSCAAPAVAGRGDLDGDGRADRFCHDQDGAVSVALGNGGRQVRAASPYPEGACGAAGRQLVAADGALFCLDAGRIHRARFAGGSFQPEPGPILGAWCDAPGARLGSGDLDGDGRADLTCLWTSATTGRTWLETAHAPRR